MHIEKIFSIFSNSILNLLQIRRKPTVLQLPITSRCNSMCKTCNIWKLTEKKDINPVLLQKVLSDSFFNNIKHVGLNGGEITLVPNWKEILEVILKLKKIKSVHIISNGLKKENLLIILKEAKTLCNSYNVRLGFTLSVDGINSIHDNIRGIPKAYPRIKYLLDEISSNKNKYCDDFIIGCTISQYNIPYIREIEYELQKYSNAYIEYHLAVPNKRIHTFNNSTDYNVLYDERSRILATEFFYRKSKEAVGLTDKIKFFSIYFYLKNKGNGRLCNCNYLYKDVTIDENLNLYLCATASNTAGSLIEKSATTIKRNGILKKLSKENHNYCNQCIHYSSTPTIKGLIIYVVDNLSTKYNWNHKFKYLVKWQKSRL